jgi:uncharacterized protein
MTTALPFLDLFLELQSEFQLSISQYEDFQKAIAFGYGTLGWDSLRQVCRALWCQAVPGSQRYQRFDGRFDRYQARYEHFEKSIQPTGLPSQTKIGKVTLTPLGQLPQLPPRQRIEPEPQPETVLGNVPSAVQSIATSREPVRANPNGTPIEIDPNQLPVTLSEVKTLWRSLRNRAQSGQQREIDIAATMRAIQREGLYADVVLRPVLTRKTDLLMLVDTHNAMLPYQPVVQPFIQAVDQQWLHPAERYTFTAYPDEVVFDWDRPSQAHFLWQLLPRLHPNRTVALILSDGGAALGDRSPARVDGMAVFLSRLVPCVRQVLWINPVSADRWSKSAAGAIASLPGNCMVALDEVANLTPAAIAQAAA